MVNSIRNEIAYSIGVSSEMLPLYMVASQLNTLTPDGIATRNVSAEKTTVASSRLAGDEHVMAPDEEAQQRERHARVGDGAVAEDRLARERRDQFADDRHARQNHDVDGRVRVEPEEVLEQHRIAADARIEDADLEDALEHQQDQRDRRAPGSPEPE